ncbi:HNH endonuclease [Rhodococcus sp. NPDC058639]|uniref:HNH endonuclease signature motif containing protein n=1 Tax=Rhodococcus sp. NPDC058639 TaxID=3346570 RepID=UPI0036663526
MARPLKYTKDVLEEAVRHSTNVAEVMRYFGLTPNGGHHTHLGRRIKALGIDTSHFTGRPRLPSGGAGRQHWTEILTERPRGAPRVKPHLLRRALLETGREHRCAVCSTGPVWNGERLVFHVDHIDGNPNDSRPENVRFLCPNCHSQTPTWAGRRRFGFESACQEP